MSNRLAGETSPYLLQHADNPVAWQPWDAAALAQAKREDRPILLSIGYSACHWCHVMAHESFADAEVAALMNRLFVNIKVDREERPDLDQIYQTAQQMLTRRTGGWPLTMFLDPEGVPFFGGTYFPKHSRQGLVGFMELCTRVAEFWQTRREDIRRQGGELRAALAAMSTVERGSDEPDAAPLRDFVEQAAKNFDAQHGGYRGAPKFPHAMDLQLLLRRHGATGEAKSREMALQTLRGMAEGGLFDQLAGGFCRYSVDERWEIPHFEKMLYDNGLLLSLYAEAWQLTREPLFRAVCEDTAAWVMREMQAPEGGYYSSLDADSEHEEGKFYVWTPEKVSACTTATEFAVLAAHYGLDGPANFEGKAWHLRVARPLEAVAENLRMPLAECRRQLDSARGKLLSTREQRSRPARDEKILASWNALMIEGLAHAGRLLGRDDWLDSARRAMRFIRDTLWQTGRLLATSKDGRAHLDAYLDDHAYLLKAALALLEAEFDADLLAFAQALADSLLAAFEDTENGGFFFTRHDHEALIQRTKSGFDNATPSGNGIAALALQRLGHLLGETRYLRAAERTVTLFYKDLSRQPAAFASLLMALEEYLQPPDIVILRGDAEQLVDWHEEWQKHWLPRTLCLSLPTGCGPLPAALDKPLGARVNAWLCSGVNCLKPIDEMSTLLRVCKTRELI